MTKRGDRPERLKPDYATAADAWFDHKITLLMMEMRSSVQRLAAEWQARKDEELARK